MAGGPEIFLFYLALIVVGAKIGGEIAQRFKQPPVVGELLVGIMIGPSLLGLVPSFNLLTEAEDILHDPEEGVDAGTVDAGGPAANATTDDAGGFFRDHFADVTNLAILAALANIGVLVLLFEVGLESSIKDFTRVGPSALLVALIGIVVSFFAGYGMSWFFQSQFDWALTVRALENPAILHAFIGATLTATSVGITARVLGDMGKIRSRESQVILGAAVLDDILALIILGVVGALAAGSGLTIVDVGKIFLIAIGFFVGSVALGVYLAPRFLAWSGRTFKVHGVPLAFSFALMAMVAYLATVSGLAAIVGAFAAGLMLSQSPYRQTIFDNLKPIGTIFISFFFVTLGIRVDLSSIDMTNIGLVVAVGLALTIVGIVGKLACGLGVVQPNVNRYAVGVGMVPRGEVGLIFALLGLELALINNWQYATIIIVVMATTLVTPVWLKSMGDKIGREQVAMPALARTGELVEP